MKRTLPLQTRLATFSPRSVNADARTIEVTWSSGAAVKRYDWWEDEEFFEQLDLSGANLDRLNAGAPVLNSHNRYELDSVIGVVERAWIDGNEGRAELRISDRDEVEPIWRDLQNGILRNVSIGYSIEAMERLKAPERGRPDTINVTSFTPVEISIVSVPADYRAQVRAEAQPYSVDIKEPVMADNYETAPAVESVDNESSEVVEDTPVDIDAERTAAALAERARIVEITRACQIAKLPELAESLISDGVTIDAARAQIIDALAERGGPEIRPAIQAIPAEINVAALQRKIFNQVSGKD